MGYKGCQVWKLMIVSQTNGFLGYRNGDSFKGVESEDSKMTLWFSISVARATHISFTKVAGWGPKVRKKMS